jgi:hypothetical protein
MWIVWSLAALVGVGFLLSIIDGPPATREPREQHRH